MRFEFIRETDGDETYEIPKSGSFAEEWTPLAIPLYSEIGQLQSTSVDLKLKKGLLLLTQSRSIKLLALEKEKILSSIPLADFSKRGAIKFRFEEA